MKIYIGIEHFQGIVENVDASIHEAVIETKKTVWLEKHDILRLSKEQQAITVENLEQNRGDSYRIYVDEIEI